MKIPLLLLLCAAPAYSQLFSFGVKAGVPLTDFVNAASGTNPAGFVDFATHTNRYIVGATGELHLPFGLSLEADVLYRHFNYQESTMGVDTSTTASTTGNAWEFPILGKYRFLRTKLVRPYVDAGVAFDTLQGAKQAVTNTLFAGSNSTTTTTSGSPMQLENSTTRGYVFGGGIDIKIFVIHIQPEIRYTRWGAKHFFDPSGLLHSNENQGEFLLGITF
ncbi:MAG TPA: outer membrane beta-barrel protein [Bryobacteraceae bacterium]|jgi:opacity protein-like surface antigen|nr:outer membrane beta-barrel protein [Bryobacteraceae bacterium]